MVAGAFSSTDLVDVMVVSKGLANGATDSRQDYGFSIPAGASGAGSFMACKVPITSLSVGTLVEFSFLFITSSAIDGESIINSGAAVSKGDGTNDALVAPFSEIVPTVWKGTITRQIQARDIAAEFYFVIGGASGVRTASAQVLIAQASMTVSAASDPQTSHDEVASYRAAIDGLRSTIEGYGKVVYVSPSGGDYSTIRAAVAAETPGRRAGSPTALFVAPARYSSEAGVGLNVKPGDYILVDGQGPEDEVVIDARLPGNTADQSAISPLDIIAANVHFRNLTVLGENVRYPAHIEAGAVRKRSTQVFEDVTFRHYGSTGWGSHTAVGVGHHTGNKQIFRRCTMISPTLAYGCHNNVDWMAPATVQIEDSHLVALEDEGQALSAGSIGAGVMSSISLRNCVLNGHVYAFTSGWQSRKIGTHRGNRYEYKIVADNCSPFDWRSACAVEVLELRSVAGGASNIYMQGAARSRLFGNLPAYRLGGVGYAARAYSQHAVAVLSGEYDPGVSLAARLGNRASDPWTLELYIDGGSNTPIVLDANYSAMTNAQVVTNLNAKLAAALGGSAGGRAFMLSTPYQNRAPIFQPSREGMAKNSDSTAILKGHALKWDGRHVKLMTAADAVDLFAGIALDEGMPGQPTRFQRNGWINGVHLIFTGAPSVSLRDKFEIGGQPGELVEGSTRPILRARSAQSFGPTFELLAA